MTDKEVQLAERVTARDHIAELHTARKSFTCAVCKQPIESGYRYYSVVMTGSGLGGLKFPDRCHAHCLQQCLNRKEAGYDRAGS